MLSWQIRKHPQKRSCVWCKTETLFKRIKKKVKVGENLAGLKQGAGVGGETVYLCCWMRMMQQMRGSRGGSWWMP